MEKLLPPMGDYLRYACPDRDYDLKSSYCFALKTTITTRKSAFDLTDCFERVLRS